VPPAVTYRPGEAEELGFIVSSWQKSFRTAYAAGLIQMTDWADVMEPQLCKVLARPAVRVWVAANPHTEDRRLDVHGWIAVEHDPDGAIDREPPLIHYCYVKQAYRRMGLATGLVKAAGIDTSVEFHYTCKTPVVTKIALPCGRWRPLRARFAPKHRTED
jgi:GNAT superfamily N-acetyltransferase